MAYQILANGELTKDAVHNVLDRLKRTDDDLIVTQTTPSSETNETTISGKKEVNGVNINTLNFDQFCCIMSELLLHHYYNSARSLSTLLSTNKTNFFVQSVSVALTKLLGKCDVFYETRCVQKITCVHTIPYNRMTVC